MLVKPRGSGKTLFVHTRWLPLQGETAVLKGKNGEKDK